MVAGFSVTPHPLFRANLRAALEGSIKNDALPSSLRIFSRSPDSSAFYHIDQNSVTELQLRASGSGKYSCLAQWRCSRV